MNYILLVCVDAAWGYAKNNQLPWHLPEETAHYHRTISKQSNKAFIIGKNTWLSASDADKKIMTESSLCCLISTTYSPSDEEPILQFSTVAQARQFLEQAHQNIEHVYIIGGKDIYLESLQLNMVTTLIISKLRAVFECDRLVPELDDYLASRFFCASQTYCAQAESVDFIIEEWTLTPPKTSILSHSAYGVDYSLSVHPNVLQQPIAYGSWTLVLHFIINCIHQYCNPYMPQSLVFELIAVNIFKLLSYFLPPESIYSVAVSMSGRVIFEQKTTAIIERQEFKDWGWVDVLFENNFLNTTVLCVNQDKTIQKHYHDAMLEHELFMSGVVHTYYEQGPLLSIKPLAQFNRSFNMVHGYLNTAEQPAKVISLNDRIFDMKYEVMYKDDYLPNSLAADKLNCLIVGSMDDVAADLYEQLHDNYNLIFLDKTAMDDGRFYIPLDFNDLDSIFQISNALPQLHIDVLIIANNFYSGSLRREQPSHIFEQTIQLNYLGPVFLLLELINHHMLDCKTKIMVLSSFQKHGDELNACWESGISPHDLLKEPEHFEPNRQHALAQFALFAAIRYLFEHGYNIAGLNLATVSDSRLVDKQPSALIDHILTLLAKERFEYYQETEHKDLLATAVLNYDCASLWDYSRSLYFKIAHLPQKMCSTTLYRPITLWTWNILGIKTGSDALNLNRRMSYLLQKIYYEQPDILCLQEITQTIWQDYLKPFSEKNAYRLSAMPIDIVDAPDKVFVATLSRLFPCEEQLIELEKDASGKDYYCLYQKYDQFELINIHLLSGADNQAKRMVQMKQILSSIKLDNNCLIMGDFNSDLNQTDMSLSEHDILDVWHVMRPQQQGDTEDLEHNLLRQQLKKHDTNTYSRRVDGIFAHKDIISEFLTVERLGLEEVVSNQFISDHYGLTCVLQFKLH